MFKKLMNMFRKDVGAPVHVGANPVYFTDVHQGANGWVFSWRTNDHSTGGVFEYDTQASARDARACWTKVREARELATFVHEG